MAPASTMVLMIGSACLDRSGAFVQQRRMLRGAEKPGLRITVFLLPARDSGAGRLVELSVDLGIKPQFG
jgi:hypothetical protein